MPPKSGRPRTGRAGREAFLLERRERRTRLTVEQWKIAIERACGTLNPVLAAIVIGLLILNISCYTALEIGRHPPRPEMSPALPPPALARTLGSGPP